jgi:hypothetical protein
MQHWLVWPAVASILVSFSLLPAGADAHGGRLQCELAPAGAYVVSVWTAPDPARVGLLDFSASILRADTRRPVSDVGMRLTARAAAAPGFVEGVGSRAAGGLFDFLAPPLYHVKVDIPAPGRWHVSVSVAGSAGRGEVGFDIDVAPPLTIPWRMMTAGVAVSVLLLAAWLAAKGRAGRPRPS